MASLHLRNVVRTAAVMSALLAPCWAPADAPKAASGTLISLAAPKDFTSAVQALEQVTGAKGEKMRVGEVPLADGRSFAVDPRITERLLEGSHTAFKKAGLYLFRYERSFGLDGDKDQIALLRTADRNVVIKRVGTVGPHQTPTSKKIAAWLDVLAKEEPFELWEIGADYVAGRFLRTPKDPVALAQRCAQFAPDLVAGRASTLELLAHEIAANRTLYLIW